MISKELLSEVLNIGSLPIQLVTSKDEKVEWFLDTDNLSARVAFEARNGFSINIYELAHKCKEWAMNNSWYLETLVNSVGAKCTMTTFDRKLSISAKSEPEVIFDACEFILEQKAKV